MAVCDIHGPTAGGRSRSLYVTMVLGLDRRKRQCKFCLDCIEDVRSLFGKQWSDGLVLRKDMADAACASCQTEMITVTDFWKMYVTGYNQANLRFDYYALYCRGCAPQVISHFGLEGATNGRG